MPMPKRKIGDHLLVKLPGGRMVETTYKFRLTMRLR